MILGYLGRNRRNQGAADVAAGVQDAYGLPSQLDSIGAAVPHAEPR